MTLESKAGGWADATLANNSKIKKRLGRLWSACFLNCYEQMVVGKFMATGTLSNVDWYLMDWTGFRRL